MQQRTDCDHNACVLSGAVIIINLSITENNTVTCVIWHHVETIAWLQIPVDNVPLVEILHSYSVWVHQCRLCLISDHAHITHSTIMVFLWQLCLPRAISLAHCLFCSWPTEVFLVWMRSYNEPPVAKAIKNTKLSEIILYLSHSNQSDFSISRR